MKPLACGGDNSPSLASRGKLQGQDAPQHRDSEGEAEPQELLQRPSLWSSCPRAVSDFLQFGSQAAIEQMDHLHVDVVGATSQFPDRAQSPLGGS